MADNNGISDKILQHAAEEIDTALKSRGLTKVDRIHLQTNKNVLIFLSDERGRIKSIEHEISEIKKNSLGMWIKNNKRLAIFLIISWMVFSSAFYVSGWRRPLLIFLGVPAELVP